MISAADKLKLAMAGLLVLAGLAGFYYLVESPLVVRVLCVLAGLGGAVAVGWFTDPGRQLHAFTQESITETKKVVWPTRKETIQSTGYVVAFVVIMAIFLWIVDGALFYALGWLLGRGE